MSETTTPLSPGLKAAVNTAIDAHVAVIGEDATKVKNALANDLAGVVTTSVSELGRLRSDVAAVASPLMRPIHWLISAGSAVAGGLVTAGHYVLHWL